MGNKEVISRCKEKFMERTRGGGGGINHQIYTIHQGQERRGTQLRQKKNKIKIKKIKKERKLARECEGNKKCQKTVDNPSIRVPKIPGKQTTNHNTFVLSSYLPTFLSCDVEREIVRKSHATSIHHPLLPLTLYILSFLKSLPPLHTPSLCVCVCMSLSISLYLSLSFSHIISKSAVKNKIKN
ncbi:predicted protein [Lodderomyces elongisporus NRRL YB-4239]|uniref:Uncharacterized protein n=1 Tax=Lodderomyces elongisporus (strain ATCC 11503 / CBS 2605 / JCM 1781 / NBRC 1676 / NRRL YB-4239) TaxID=379508 RepID=A5E0D4_LODEL|nr:predicted protein [Lodderomyces elongisporus NRRL YB-4239]